VLRRSFRIGLLVGLLGGAIAAAVKAVQGRATTQPASGPAPTWTPIPDAQPVVVPEPVRQPETQPPPKPRVERPAVSIADLQEAPAPVKKAPAAKKAPAKKAAAKLPPWVEPINGECPPTHPVKGKLASKIYHLPGGFNYARTRPDRCYRDAAAAEADGLRPSKR
jgi:hypothetical protein